VRPRPSPPLLPLKAVESPLKAIWYRSWTKLLGYAQALSGAGLLALSEVNSYIQDPTFKSYLDMLSVPKSVTIGLALIGIITWLAHGRSDA
jgi:hypothetical protein